MKKILLSLCLLALLLFPVSCGSKSANNYYVSKPEELSYAVSKGGADEQYDYYTIIKGIEKIKNSGKKYDMYVVSKENIEASGNDEQKDALKLLNDLLDGNQVIAYDEYNFHDDKFNMNIHVNTLFLDAFPEGVSDVSGEIANLDADGYDKIKAFYTVDGNSPPMGNIVVVAYAQKGDDYYMFSTPAGINLEDEKAAVYPAFNKCLEEHGYTDEARKCFVVSMKDDKEFQELLTTKANELINSFPKDIVDSNEARKALENKG